MKWRLHWRRHTEPAVGTDRSRAEAEAQLRAAEAKLREVRHRSSHIHEVNELLKGMRQRNGFAEIVELALRRPKK